MVVVLWLDSEIILRWSKHDKIRQSYVYQHIRPFIALETSYVCSYNTLPALPARQTKKLCSRGLSSAHKNMRLNIGYFGGNFGSRKCRQIAMLKCFFQ